MTYREKEIMPIYLITTFTQIEPDDRFLANLGASRAVGFYYNKKDAFESVKVNSCDIWEMCYDYAVIEEVEQGMYPECYHRWFFKYNRAVDRYEEINEPECVKHLMNFSIG